MPTLSAAWGCSPRAQAQAKAGAVEDESRDDKDQQANIGGDVGVWNSSLPKTGMSQRGYFFDAEGIGKLHLLHPLGWIMRAK